MQRSFVLTLLAFSLPVTAVAAQTEAQVMTTVTGRIERAPADRCNLDATHRIQCSNLLLKSDVVDLRALENQTVVLVGDVPIDPSCNTMTVESAEAATEITTIFAPLGFRPGRTVIFTTRAPVGSIVAYLCGEPGFLPLPFGFGSFLIDPLTATFWATDISIGITPRLLTIPNNSDLIGLRPIFQTLYLSISPPAASVLNATCFTIVQ